MKNNFTLHYIIGVAALAVAFYALYLLYQNNELNRSLILTVVACLMVAVGQLIIIRQKRKPGRK
jgi:hypothetical protein